jgi:hypothetical protein
VHIGRRERRHKAAYGVGVGSWGIRPVALALAAGNLIGQAVAQRDGIPARPFGIPSPVGGRGEPWVWGTALSGPLPMVAVIAVAACTGGSARSRRLLRVAGLTEIVGQLAEPVVWRSGRSRHATAVIIGNLALAAAVAVRP